MRGLKRVKKVVAYRPIITVVFDLCLVNQVPCQNLKSFKWIFSRLKTCLML